MKESNKNIRGMMASVCLSLLAAGLLGYTASRTIDLIQVTLPPNSQILAYFALAAFDGGLLGWFAVHRFQAQNEEQLAISLFMVVLCGIGVTVAFIADTILVAGNKGIVAKLSEDSFFLVLIIMAVIITANGAAYLAYELYSPAHNKRKTDLQLYNAIQRRVDEHLGASIDELAARAAPIKAMAILKKLEAEQMAGVKDEFKRPAKKLLPPTKGQTRSAVQKLRLADEFPAMEMEIVEDEPEEDVTIGNDYTVTDEAEEESFLSSGHQQIPVRQNGKEL